MRATRALALLLLAACTKPEAPSPQPRRSALDRAATLADKPAADAHEGWLAIVDDLERERAGAPKDAGVLRDLLVAYGQLLAFERASGLGASVCLVASQRLGEFEKLAAPLSADDHDLAWQLRAWLAFVMGMTPLSAEAASTLKSPGRADGMRKALAALGQRTFQEGPNFACGPLRVRPFLNRGVSPDPELLWPERCYVASPMDDAALDRTAMLAVCRMDGRWSLWLYALNRRELVLPLGSERPAERVVRSHVVRFLEDAGGAR